MWLLSLPAPSLVATFVHAAATWIAKSARSSCLPPVRVSFFLLRTCFILCDGAHGCATCWHPPLVLFPFYSFASTACLPACLLCGSGWLCHSCVLSPARGAAPVCVCAKNLDFYYMQLKSARGVAGYMQRGANCPCAEWDMQAVNATCWLPAQSKVDCGVRTAPE